MNALCIACPGERRAEIGNLCPGCANRILTHIRQIEHLFYALAAIPSTGASERRAPGFGSRSPARDDVIVQTDPRSRGDDHGPAALAAVCSWTRLVAFEREVTQSVNVSMAGEAQFLRAHHDWICHQPWCDDYAAELHQIRDRLRALAGFSPPRAAGRCMVVDCTGSVYPTEDAAGVQCNVCRRLYTGLELTRLQVAS